MAKLQAVTAILLISLWVTAFGSVAEARDKWGAELSYGGYLGDCSIGALREWNERHSLHLSFGYYSIESTRYTQLNFGYNYQTPWYHRFESNNDLSWHFFTVGGYLLRSLDNTHYFRASPGKYPTAGYYDETALRFGLRMATSVRFWDDKAQISYFMMVLDNGLIASYNNQHERSLIAYFISHGLAVSYRF
ncbi:hypothetical protein [Pseudobdellovibrio exovorus]|uniref:Outer membrane protein beta-barrel domain-containing protein n=1 Tax=Pseudobdellovibrio exovorus JSS TaxID=1184267 RepID=M4VF73_9BACT|nr:hypothetical protein [Pseudobdellovibrio exovorus]AGH96701.1 hypothetical protein A11Q_2485 [Pseudobdellovibrio exovorus JSS]